jgi:tRNA1(Val) A37 N6-methylase TrmN6
MADPDDRVTDDAFLGDALAIYQPAEGYRAGLDAVLMAAACGATVGQHARVLDVGAGVGVAGLCVARRVSDAHVTLVEREPALADLARRNIDRNGLQDRARVVELDVAAGGAVVHRARVEARAEVPPDGARVLPGAFTHVIANPPYFAHGHGTAPSARLKAASHQMAGGDLDAWFRFIATAASRDGVATMIHRAEALGVLIDGIGQRFGALRVLPLYPRAGDAAHRVIVQGRKGSRAPLTLLPGVALHGEGHAFIERIDAVLRGGAALEW